MRRLARYILNAITLLSLALCLAAAVLWRTGESGHTRFYRHPRFGSYALVWDRQQITVMQLPPGVSVGADVTVEAAYLAARLKNDDITFAANFAMPGRIDGVRFAYVIRSEGVQPVFESRLPIYTPTQSALMSLATSPQGGVARLMTSRVLLEAAEPFLVRALDQPESFVAAHALLSRLKDDREGDWIDAICPWTLDASVTFPPENNVPDPHPAGLALPATCNGLHVTLRQDGYLFRDRIDFPSKVEVTPEERERVREQWHRRLDGQVGTISTIGAILWATLLPGVRAVLFVRHWRKRRSTARDGADPDGSDATV